MSDKRFCIQCQETAVDDKTNLTEAAYLYHANALSYDDEQISAFMQSTLAKLLDDNLSGDELTALALETGKVGVDVYTHGEMVPAFLSPNVAKVLVENFGIVSISNVEEYIKEWID